MTQTGVAAAARVVALHAPRLIVSSSFRAGLVEWT
jgi:hypothetical protein